MPIATPVAIATLVRTSNVVTVTTVTAHGLVANQGFSIQGVTLDSSFNVNSTVVSVTSATVYTFNQTAANSSIGAGGTSQPAKEVIVLLINVTNGNYFVNYLFWLTTALPLANGTLVSLWTGVSAAETNAIRAGTTIEQAGTQSYPTTYSKAQIQSDLQGRFSASQSELQAGVQPGQFYGGFFDGTGWSF